MLGSKETEDTKGQRWLNKKGYKKKHLTKQMEVGNMQEK